MDRKTEEGVTAKSSDTAIKVGAIIGAVVGAVPAVPVAWIGAVFSFGDDPHPILGVIRSVVIGLMIIGGGTLCGGAIGAIVARVTKGSHDD